MALDRPKGIVVKYTEANMASRDLRAIFEVGSLGSLSDGELLDRFIAVREEAVFEAIIHRHGPMVWGVCRRILRDHHDAEDAFQAAFLVLARRAASVVPREKVGHWLYGVAYQTSTKARALRARKRVRECHGPDLPEPEQVTAHPDERLALLDLELSRLPEKYRTPILLCELERKSHKEAAEQLGWPIGTVSGRLSRAKAMLATRLGRLGVPLSVSSLTVLLTQDASASPPISLIGPTARAATLLVAGRVATAGMVSAEVMTIMEGVLGKMLLSKIKVTATVVAIGLTIAAGGTSLAHRARVSGGPTREKAVETHEGLVGLPEGPQAQASKPQVVSAKVQEKPVDPMLSYPFKIDPDAVYELPELTVEYRDFRMKAGPVSVVPISSEPGITGAMIIGKGTFRYTPEAGKVIEGLFQAAMLRFNPAEWTKIVPIEKGKKVSDRGVAEMSRQMLQVSIRHCWQSNKQGGRIQEVLIPPKGAFAAVLYSKEHGDLLISFDDRTANAFNFTDRKALYEKK